MGSPPDECCWLLSLDSFALETRQSTGFLTDAMEKEREWQSNCLCAIIIHIMTITTIILFNNEYPSRNLNCQAISVPQVFQAQAFKKQAESKVSM